jgi:hypothetical protein
VVVEHLVAMKTYWHLAAARKKPSDYEIASSRLLYYPGRGFEVRMPIARWYADHQAGSPLRCGDWDAFRDPRETTYTRYVELAQDRERFVAGILAADRRPPATAWLAGAGSWPAVLRYPCHALEMLAAYVGHLAPAGRIVIACAFQAGDELRRVERFAYRMRQLDQTAGPSAAVWQRDAAWQPLREVVERLLVTYDWGEALIALCFAFKPRFDEVFGTELAAAARGAGDEALAHVLGSLGEDARWHRGWSAELIRHALRDRPANREVIASWLAKWDPWIERALAPFGPSTAVAEAVAEHRRAAELA